MYPATILCTLGLMLLLLSFSFLPPLFVEYLYQDGHAPSFFLPFLGVSSIGFFFWFSFKNRPLLLRTPDGFLIIALFWLTASLVNALPFWLAPHPTFSFTNAFFESVSGITTTGATILENVDDLSHALLYYRHQTQFIGGISIIVLAVAILPALGIGGMQLFRAEMTGPTKDDKLTPRVTQAAKGIWGIYLFIIALCAFSYWVAGMSAFDAICHSFSTISTGGFSTHNESFGYFQSPLLEMLAVFFMFLGATNFNLHFLLFKTFRWQAYLTNIELQTFAKVLLCVTFLTFVTLLLTQVENAFSLGSQAAFQVMSMATTTGFLSADWSVWPLFITLLLLFCGIVGGCSGSTSGGIKTMRVLLLQKQGMREIYRLIHPRGQYVVTLNEKAVSLRIIEGVWGFFAIYFITFIFFLLALLITENDLLTAYSTLLSCIANIGPGLGIAKVTFTDLTANSKWLLSAAMLAGRLEIFTLLVLFSPAFWRR